VKKIILFLSPFLSFQTLLFAYVQYEPTFEEKALTLHPTIAPILTASVPIIGFTGQCKCVYREAWV